MRTLAIALALIAGTAAQPSSAKEAYRTSGTCDGIPRVALKRLPGTCVGLVAEDQNRSLLRLSTP